MKILFLGGTGTISMSASLRVLDAGHELYLLNRGHRNHALSGRATIFHANIHDEAALSRLLEGHYFDCVVDFIAFDPSDIARDYRLFHDKCGQYVFISSASAYQKPPRDLVITEKTPLENPYWEYSRKKIACEALLHEYAKDGFPFTIVRPSHTYDERKAPTAIHGQNGSYSILERMKSGKPVLLFGDGNTHWTLTHARDFAIGLVGLFGNPLALGEAFHITSDESLTWNEIYHALARALNVEFHPCYVPLDVLASSRRYDLRGTLLGDKAYSLRFDNAKVKKACPEFTAKIPFSQGIQDTVSQILAHEQWQNEDPEFDAWCDEVVDTGKVI